MRYSQPIRSFPAPSSVLQGVLIWLSGSVQMPPSSFQPCKQPSLPLANCSRRLSPSCHLLSIFPTSHIFFFLKHSGQTGLSSCAGQEITHDTGTHKGCFQFGFHALTFTRRQLPPELRLSFRESSDSPRIAACLQTAQAPQACQQEGEIPPQLTALHVWHCCLFATDLLSSL